MSSASSDEAPTREARYKKFLEPIRDLALNWNIDVANDLEQYLDELDDISVSFDGGKTSLNFAEAALLIQGSVVVYSRKVEYLYSLIYHALDVLSAKCASRARGRQKDPHSPPVFSHRPYVRHHYLPPSPPCAAQRPSRERRSAA
jgi:hypothetical protein